MAEIQIIHNRDLPEFLYWQIISLYRSRWGEIVGRRTDWFAREMDRTRQHFVIVEEKHLIVHATTHTQSISIGDESIQILGIGGVYTFPAYRGASYASQIMRAIADYANAQTEIAMCILFCKPELQPLYESVGWERLDSAQLHFGERNNPQTVERGFLMVRYANSVTQELRDLMQTKAIYLGNDLW
ncbi:MAG: GNAT family N-acetyltransferase [Aggregatilineales bacterium]